MNTNKPVPENITNQVFLQGKITKAPELKKTENGNSMCNFTMATINEFKGLNGQTKKVNDYHFIKAWGKLAVLCQQNYEVGSEIKIKGKLKTSSYQKNGQKVFQTSVELQQIKEV